MIKAVYTERDEYEWTFALRRVGTFGLLWIVIKLLIRHNVIDVDELRDAVFTDAGNQ